MMTIDKRIKAFARLGKKIQNMIDRQPSELETLVTKCFQANNWFIQENVMFSLRSISSMLQEDRLEQWISKYKLAENIHPKNVLVIMAGNIPAVGFHDFLSVLISGNCFVGKLSSDDALLIPAFAEILIKEEPLFSEQIRFAEGKTEGFDAVIATGSDNSSRYFEYYFGKYPHIIRRNRNSMAVLAGKETEEELAGLADDICLYFGLGCRSVSKIFVPVDFDIQKLFNALDRYKNTLTKSNKYMNNYEYHKSLYLLNSMPFYENGFMIFQDNDLLASPVAVLNVHKYSSQKDVTEYIKSEKEKLQCVVGNLPDISNAVPFGKSQQPELWDYADGVDTVKFLVDHLNTVI